MAKGAGKGKGSQVDPAVVALAHAYMNNHQIRKAVNARVHSEINPQVNQINRDITTRTQQGDSLAQADQSIYGAVAQKYAGLTSPTDTSGYGTYAKELAGAMSARGAQEAGFAKSAASQDVVGLQGKRGDLLRQAGQLRTQYTSDLNQQNFTNTVTAETLLGKQAIQEGLLGVARKNANTNATRATNAETDAQRGDATKRRGQDKTLEGQKYAVDGRTLIAQAKKTGHLTPLQISKLGDAMSGAMEYAGQQINSVKGGKNHVNAHALLQQLLAGSPSTHSSSIDPKTLKTTSTSQAGTKWPALIAAAAAEAKLYGGLTQATIKRIHRLFPGFAVKGYGKAAGPNNPLSG